MNTHKIFTYTALALGVIGLILQVVILSQGDDVIKLNALSGDYGVISTMVTLALLVLAITVILTLVFSFGNLASDRTKLKRALVSIGAFIVVVLVAFLFSTGTETPHKYTSLGLFYRAFEPGPQQVKCLSPLMYYLSLR